MKVLRAKLGQKPPNTEYHDAENNQEAPIVPDAHAVVLSCLSNDCIHSSRLTICHKNIM